MMPSAALGELAELLSGRLEQIAALPPAEPQWRLGLGKSRRQARRLIESWCRTRVHGDASSRTSGATRGALASDDCAFHRNAEAADATLVAWLKHRLRGPLTRLQFSVGGVSLNMRSR